MTTDRIRREERRARVGTVLAKARAAKGLSQKQLAQAIHRSPGFIGQIEAGVYPLSRPATIDDLAVALSLDPDELYVAAGRMPPDVLKKLPQAVSNVHQLNRLRNVLEDFEDENNGIREGWEGRRSAVADVGATAE